MANPFADLSSETANPLHDAKIVCEDADPEAYHKQDAKRGDANYVMCRSDLVEFARCPHRWVNGYAMEENDSLVWGSLIDCLLLTPKRFSEAFAVKPETYKDAKTGEDKPWNGNATVCKDWLKANENKICIKSSQLEDAQKAIKLITDDSDIAKVLEKSKKQVMLTATFDDALNGIQIPLRFLIDVVPENKQWLCDLKSTRSAEPKEWTRAVYSRGYHVQAAMFLDAWNMATGEDRDMFAHIIQENFSPYEVAKRYIEAQFINMGRGFYVKALQDYAQCIKTGVWPGYDAEAECVVDGFSVCEPVSWMVLSDA